MEEEINQRLRTLDSLRSQLSIWYSHQIMLQMCRTNLAVTNVDDRLQALHQEVSTGLITMNTSVMAIDKLADEICNRIASRPSLLADLAQHDTQRRRPSYLGCRCQQFLKHTIELDYKFFRYQKRIVESHKPGCPYFGRHLAKRIESSLRCSLFSRCIEISLARPQCLGSFSVISIVDELTAPSFERFRQASREVCNALWGTPSFAVETFQGDITNTN